MYIMHFIIMGKNARKAFRKKYNSNDKNARWFDMHSACLVAGAYQSGPAPITSACLFGPPLGRHALWPCVMFPTQMEIRQFNSWMRYLELDYGPGWFVPGGVCIHPGVVGINPMNIGGLAPPWDGPWTWPAGMWEVLKQWRDGPWPVNPFSSEPGTEARFHSYMEQLPQLLAANEGAGVFGGR